MGAERTVLMTVHFPDGTLPRMTSNGALRVRTKCINNHNVLLGAGGLVQDMLLVEDIDEISSTLKYVLI